MMTHKVKPEHRCDISEQLQNSDPPRHLETNLLHKYYFEALLCNTLTHSPVEIAAYNLIVIAALHGMEASC